EITEFEEGDSSIVTECNTSNKQPASRMMTGRANMKGLPVLVCKFADNVFNRMMTRSANNADARNIKIPN
ncbi:hypothetical protein Tco_1411244, partial [Tanacetum coccineum]